MAVADAADSPPAPAIGNRKRVGMAGFIVWVTRLPEEPAASADPIAESADADEAAKLASFCRSPGKLRARADCLPNRRTRFSPSTLPPAGAVAVE